MNIHKSNNKIHTHPYKSTNIRTNLQNSMQIKEIQEMLRKYTKIKKKTMNETLASLGKVGGMPRTRFTTDRVSGRNIFNIHLLIL